MKPPGNVICLIFSGFLTRPGHVLGRLRICLTVSGIPFVFKQKSLSGLELSIGDGSA